MRACVVAANECQVDRDEGRLIAAREKMVACASESCPTQVKRDCVQWLDDLDRRLPSLVVRVVDEAERDVTDAQVQIDGVEITLDGRPVRVDPGRRSIDVQVPDAPPVHQMVLAAEREVARVLRIQVQRHVATQALATPVLQPLAARATRDERALSIPTGAWILGGVGVLALGSFTYFGITASEEHAELRAQCGKTCSDAQVQAGRDYALVADLSLVTGLAALAGGVLWTLVGQKDSAPHSSVQASLAPVRNGGLIGSVSGVF
jgi:hypothetical protein